MAQALEETVIKYGQPHLLQHLNELEQPAKSSFRSQLMRVDFAGMRNLYENVYMRQKEGKEDKTKLDISPLTAKMTKAELKGAGQGIAEIGLDAIRKGEVAVCTLAGGQGSRLGFQFPKGLYDPGLQSKKSIFHFFADNLKALTSLALGRPPKSPVKLLTPWAIMVNDQTEDLVRRYFKDHEYFGLAEESVLIFPQQTLPAVDFEGRVIIDSPGHLFLSPNGNGGIFSSIHSTGTLKRLTELGVKHINVQSTDNLLACHADPEAVGFHIKSQLTITSKYLAKRDPAEKVGVHVLKGGRPGVVEYGELPAELEARRDEHGQLVFGDAYVGMFVIRSEFIAQINTDKESLQRLNRMYHVALKKVPCLSAGTVTKPDKPNAVKFELFIFDLFSMADSMGVIEILREEEFAPIKNAEGEDSPESSRLLLSRLHKRWLEAAGLTFEGEPDGKTRLVQVDNKLTYKGEGLAALAARHQGSPIALPFLLHE